MVTFDYEIIVLGDFRETSFRHTTVADQIKALALAGYQIGLLATFGRSATSVYTYP